MRTPARSGSRRSASICWRRCARRKLMPAWCRSRRSRFQRAGGRVLMNGMDLEDAKNNLGGAFEFMGVAVRTKEIAERRPEMVALAKALGEALKALHAMSGEAIVAAFPKEMT